MIGGDLIRIVRQSYNKYVTETLVKVNALRVGVEPQYNKASCFSCMSLPDVIEPMPVPTTVHDLSMNTSDGVSTVGTVISEDHV